MMVEPIWIKDRHIHISLINDKEHQCQIWFQNRGMVSEREEFEENKRVIRICMSKKNRQHNGQQKKYKRITTIYKTYTSNNRSSNTSPIETGGEPGCSRRVGSTCSTSGTFYFWSYFCFSSKQGFSMVRPIWILDRHKHIGIIDDKGY